MDQSFKITNKWSGPVLVIIFSKNYIFRMIIKRRLKLPTDPTGHSSVDKIHVGDFV